MPRAIASEKHAEVAQLLQEGYSRGEVHRRTGISESYIRKHFGRDKRYEDRRARIAELQVQAEEMIRNGATYYGISRALGVGESSLRRWFGPSPHPPGEEFLRRAHELRRQESERRYRAMVRLRMAEGKTNREIADALGLNISTIRRAMGPTPPRLGGNRQWNPSMHERARFLRECGNTIDEISAKTGVPRGTVGDWVRGMPCGL